MNNILALMSETVIGDLLQSGQLSLSEHNGQSGVWINTDEGRFFQVYGKTRTVELGTPYDDSTLVSDKEGLDFIESWAKTNGKFQDVSHLPFNIDKRTHRVLNWDDVKDHLHLEHVDPTSVALNELYCVNLSPWPTLKAGDKWVTLKPHGHGSDSYVRVIIREHSDGTAHVVWAGDKGLLHLKLGGLGKARSREGEEAKKSRPMSPTDQQAYMEMLAQREQAGNDEKQAFGMSLAQLLGGQHDPMELAQVFGDKPTGGARDEKQRTMDIARRQERAQQILSGELPESPGRGEKVSGERAAIEASLQDILGEMPSSLSGVSPELQQTWDQARQDPNVARQVAALRSQHMSRMRSLNRMPNPNEIDVIDRMAFYEDPGENERKLLSDARNRAEYIKNSEFYDRLDTPEVASGYREHLTQGATDALTSIGSTFGTGKRINPAIIHKVGLEAAAAAIAHDIAVSGMADDAIKGITQHLAKSSLPTVEEALAAADECDAAREMLRGHSPADGLTDIARVNALQNQTARKCQVLGRALGSLEAAASVVDHLKRGTADGVSLSARDGDHLGLLDLLSKVGITQGDGSANVVQDEHGNPSGVQITPSGMGKWMNAVDKHASNRELIRSIKGHNENTDDFEVPGIKDGVHLAGSQQASIRFFEHVKKGLGNLGVGIGKTITFGSMAARLRANNVPGGWYILPTNLLDATAKELTDKFPGLNVQVAHGAINQNIHSAAERKSLYSMPSEQRPDILLIGSDTVRMDGEELASACSDPVSAPGFIFGDEIHSLFSPGSNEDIRSQRECAMDGLQAPYMFAATGTQLRRSSMETWKILNWLRPGQQGSAQDWKLRYGSMGKGVSAFSKQLGKVFANDIDDVAITENYTPDVPLKSTVRNVDLSPEQAQAYEKAELDHYQRMGSQTGGELKRSANTKTREQNQAVYGAKQNNAILDQLTQDARVHIANGERGIIHCTSLAGVEAVVSAFRPGEILPITGKTSISDRAKIISAINDGTPIEGGRARIVSGGHSFDGIVSKITPETTDVMLDSGQTTTVPSHDVESLVSGIAGTSRAVGVISTGLNLQKGSTWTAHYQLPDSAATFKQRTARNYRRGQTKTVHEYTYVPNLPNTQKKWAQIQDQSQMLSVFDDPEAFDEHDLFPKGDESLPVALSEPVWIVELRESKPDRSSPLTKAQLTVHRHVSTNDIHNDVQSPRATPGALGKGVYVSHRKTHAIDTLPSPLHAISTHDLAADFKTLKILANEHPIDHQVFAHLPSDVRQILKQSPTKLRKYLTDQGYHGITIMDSDGPRSTVVFDPKHLSNHRIMNPRDYGFQLDRGDDPIKSAVENLVVDPSERVMRTIRRRSQRDPAGQRTNPTLALMNSATGHTHSIGQRDYNSWKADVDSTLDDKTVQEMKEWYPDLLKKFTHHFGAEHAPMYMMAWLASQQNTSPSQGLSHVFRSQAWLKNIFYHAQDPKTGALLDRKLRAGLPHDRITAILKQDSEGVKDMGPKLHDFVDSAIGKTFRTVMGNDKRMGQPVAYDIHSNRDHGRVDATTLGEIHKWSKNGHLKVGGEDAEFVPTTWGKGEDSDSRVPTSGYIKTASGKRHELKAEFPGTPSEAQYEDGVEWFNGLAKHLNDTNYKGGNWDAKSAQAVGWVRVLKGLFGRPLEGTDRMFDENMAHLASELDFGAGSPMQKKFGDRWSKLSSKDRAGITKEMMEYVIPEITKHTGAIHTGSTHSIGGWHDAVNPSTNIKVLGNHDTIDLTRAMLGHALNQTGVFQYRVSENGENPAMAFVSKNKKFFSNPGRMHAFWADVRDEMTRLHGTSKRQLPAGGFTPVSTPDGRDGIIMIQDRYKDEKSRHPQWNTKDVENLASAITHAAKKHGLEGEIIDGIKTKTNYSGHDWENEGPGGEGHYPVNLAPESSELARRHVDDHIRPELEKRLEEAIAKRERDGSVDSDVDVPSVANPQIFKSHYRESGISLAEIPHGVDHARAVAKSYHDTHKESLGLPDWSPGFYHPLDEDWAYKMADHMEGLRHKPNDSKVKVAYGKLAQEVRMQYDHALQNGMKFEPWAKDGQPYRNSSEMVDDVKHNKHLWYFPSDSGFGDGGSVSHPLLEKDPEHGIPYNDMFRAVHDYFGHAQYGYQFGPRGEENAWIEHSKMFSPEAQRALTAETKGQNNWVNYGPHLRDMETGLVPRRGEKGFVHPIDRPYAEQKAALPSPEMSDWTKYEKRLLGGQYSNVEVSK